MKIVPAQARFQVDMIVTKLGHRHALCLAHDAAPHRAVRLEVDRISNLGERPAEIMAIFSKLRHKGISLHCVSEGMNAGQPTEKLVPNLLSALSTIERAETSRRTSNTIRHAKAQGTNWGRPRKMTPERQVIAARMLAKGKRGREVLAVIRGLGGPSISQSAYYLWQKAWLERRSQPRKSRASDN